MGSDITKNKRPRVNVSIGSAAAKERLKAQARRNIRFEKDTEKLLLCLDVSGSMRDPFEVRIGPSKIDALKTAASVLIGGSDSKGCLIGAIKYSSKAELVSSLTQDFEKLKSQITSVSVGGMTHIGDALDCCANHLGESRFGSSRIILVSDGREGIHKKDRASPVIVRNVIKPAGIIVDCVAIGYNADAKLLQWIANETGGVFLHPKTPEDLSRNFLQLEMRNRKLLTAGDKK